MRGREEVIRHTKCKGLYIYRTREINKIVGIEPELLLNIKNITSGNEEEELEYQEVNKRVKGKGEKK